MLCANFAREPEMKILNECGEKLLKPWLSVQNIVIGISIVYIVLLTIRLYDLNKSELSGWVQAVGAIVSIWAAWGIATQQSKREQREARRADLAKCAAVAGVIRHAIRAADLRPAEGKGTIQVGELLDGIEKSISSLDRIDVLSLPDPELVSAIFESSYSLQRLRIKIKEQEKNFFIHNHYFFGISWGYRRILQEQLEICEKIYEKIE